MQSHCEAILKAINGLSTKNEFGFIERGTGLNNSINIVVNGAVGRFFIASGDCAMEISNEGILVNNFSKSYLNGVLISLRLNLSSKIDMYSYLKQIKYKL